MKIGKSLGVMTLVVLSATMCSQLAVLGKSLGVKQTRSSSAGHGDVSPRQDRGKGGGSAELKPVSVEAVFESLQVRQEQGRSPVNFVQRPDGNYYLDVPKTRALGPFNGMPDRETPYIACKGYGRTDTEVLDIAADRISYI